MDDEGADDFNLAVAVLKGRRAGLFKARASGRAKNRCLRLRIVFVYRLLFGRRARGHFDNSKMEKVKIAMPSTTTSSASFQDQTRTKRTRTRTL